MEDVIRKYLCNSCLGKKEECMKYKEEQKNGMIQYKCEGYIYNNIPLTINKFDYKIRSNKWK